MNPQTVTAFTPKQGEILKYRREKHFFRQSTVIDLDTGNEIICARHYWTEAKNTACIWIWTGSETARGGGSATGYGYHRPSAALHEAIRSAGVTLSEPIDGRGDSAEREALLAIAEHLGIARPLVVNAHG